MPFPFNWSIHKQSEQPFLFPFTVLHSSNASNVCKWEFEEGEKNKCVMWKRDWDKNDFCVF